MKLENFNYELPESLIAQEPVSREILVNLWYLIRKLVI